MTESLFRKEVLEAKRTSWLGPISLAQPLPAWVLTAFAVVAAASILLFLIFGTYTRRTRVVGQLVPVEGLATVMAPSLDTSCSSEVPSEPQLAGAPDFSRWQREF